MTADDTKEEKPLADSPWLLICERCGRIARCGDATALEYARSRWPSCCGRVMRVFRQVCRNETDTP